ncbi:hypothetical protein, partial [Prosthecodimorpha staleyi]
GQLPRLRPDRSHPPLDTGICQQGLVSLCILSATAYFVYDQKEQSRLARARSMIAPGDIDLIDMRLGTDPMPYTNLRQLTGNVRNRSPYTLQNLRLLLTALDCPEGLCDVIGEAEVALYGLDVPSQQIRALSDSVYFRNMPKAKQFAWRWSIKTIEARTD